jgi:hypothetical protein
MYNTNNMVVIKIVKRINFTIVNTVENKAVFYNSSQTVCHNTNVL